VVRLITWAAYDRHHVRVDEEPRDGASRGHEEENGAAEPARNGGDTEAGVDKTRGDEVVDDASAGRKSQPLPQFVLFILGWTFVVIVAGFAVWIWADRDNQGFSSGFVGRAAAVFAACFVVMLLASVKSRPSDTEIADVIEEERVTARQEAAWELGCLLPGLVAGVAAAYVLIVYPQVRDLWMKALAWSPVGSWEPVAGLSRGVAGLVLAGGFAWGIRVFFTLLLGKEALGFGDVHILAAAGAVAGAGVAVLGFFAASILAVVGLAALLPVKRRRVIPFGPWLAMGVVVLVVAYPFAVEYFSPMGDVIEYFVRPWVAG
jgi:prepilin signal peptidase PulO-like enzyme (type II secretory pathway)